LKTSCSSNHTSCTNKLGVAPSPTLFAFITRFFTIIKIFIMTTLRKGRAHVDFSSTQSNYMSSQSIGSTISNNVNSQG
jgi:hypothetical protein